MHAVLSFSLLLIAFSSLTACDQMYARFVADSKTLAGRWIDSKPNSAPPANAKAASDNTDSTEIISIKVEATGVTDGKPVTYLNQKNLNRSIHLSNLCLARILL